MFALTARPFSSQLPFPRTWLLWLERRFTSPPRSSLAAAAKSRLKLPKSSRLWSPLTRRRSTSCFYTSANCSLKMRTHRYWSSLRNKRPQKIFYPNYSRLSIHRSTPSMVPKTRLIVTKPSTTSSRAFFPSSSQPLWLLVVLMYQVWLWSSTLTVRLTWKITSTAAVVQVEQVTRVQPSRCWKTQARSALPFTSLRLLRRVTQKCPREYKRWQTLSSRKPKPAQRSSSAALAERALTASTPHVRSRRNARSAPTRSKAKRTRTKSLNCPPSRSLKSPVPASSRLLTQQPPKPRKISPRG